MPNLLFVCTANICRSPMAEKLFGKVLSEKDMPVSDWHISSAGTWTTNGQFADKHAIRTMREMGLDLFQHKTRIITRQILTKQNLILVMENQHKEALQYEFPDMSDRIFLLSQMVNEEYNIDDPFRKYMPAFRICAKQMYGILNSGIDSIIHLI